MNLRSIIQKEMKRQGLTQLELAAKSKVPQNNISRFFTGTDLGADSVGKLMKALGLKVCSGGAQGGVVRVSRSR